MPVATRVRKGLCSILLGFAGVASAAVAPAPSEQLAGKLRWLHRDGAVAVAPDPSAWDRFRTDYGHRWRFRVDSRSRVPLLVEGQGIPWDLDRFEETARDLVRRHRAAIRIDEAELVLDDAASGPLDRDLWRIVFTREVGGLEIEGERLVFWVKRGRLIAFGADRWGGTVEIPEPSLDPEAARSMLAGYLERSVADLEPPRLRIVVDGESYRPAWRLRFTIEGSPDPWIADVDAADGSVLSFDSDVKHAQARGGVFPVSNDGACPDGCEQPGYPMPYLDVSIDGGAPFFAGGTGLFSCTPGGATAVTTLQGQFVGITDNCGAASESVTCDADLDLGTSAGTDCTVPIGGSPGNTHAARSNFYHLNRIKEKARFYLPDNVWLTQQLNSNVNIDDDCNASWSGGSVNFFDSGGGCANTGEIGGVVHHEFGHGLDANDGGPFARPIEAYADVTAIFQERRSCVGRGFFIGQNCDGYGDPCLSCTGLREMDWDQHQSHTPATPANYIQPNCGAGNGACGRQVHCESHVPSQAIVDLAIRDLPATGLDAASSWQLAERLWWSAREGSGGNVYNCALPSSDGCNVSAWYTELRVVDDDDGDLANGTPHAAAIFAAFDRHAIACGAATDPENQSTSSCPAMPAPVLAATPGNRSVDLEWDDIPGTFDYLVLRTEVDCDYSQNTVATTLAPTSEATDIDLANGSNYHYRVQARGANRACDSPVSNCVSITPLPDAGSVRLDRSSYTCGGVIEVSVRDANAAGQTVTATLRSSTEPSAETLTLAETEPGSGEYAATIQATTDPPSADGRISVVHGDTLIARYIDDDDGAGGSGLIRETSAGVDCVEPVINNVHETGVDEANATIRWQTGEPASSRVRWGETAPPGNDAIRSLLVTDHAVPLTGLQACTRYLYEVESVDATGNPAGDDNGGAFHAFETLGDFGQGPESCRKGRIRLLDTVVNCADSLGVEVTDLDANSDPLVADTLAVTVSSTQEPGGETLILTETAPNSAVFAGAIVTAGGAAIPGDGVLQIDDGDFITASYFDPDTGNGFGNTVVAGGDADCSQAGIRDVEVTTITDFRAQVRWNVDELSTHRIEWGTTTALGNVLQNPNLTSSTVFTLSTIPECGRAFFRAFSADAAGNERSADADGQPFELNVHEIPGAIFKDEFGGTTGWSLDGEWEIDVPQGLGTGGDPTSPFDESRVLGHDLTGLGPSPGDYEAQVDEVATSPEIDASALTDVELNFRRWLHVTPGAISSVQVKDGNTWFTIWSTNLAGVSDSLWVQQTFDISSFGAGERRLQVRFRQQGGFDANANRSGWNVDRFIIRDGGLPDYAACGGCGGAPTFGGLVGAGDADPCADSGIELSWLPAPAWGSGATGSYAVYRSTDPAFTPSPGNLIASGVGGTSFTDLTAPNDVTLHYIVRAENDETCSTGPANGGLTDPSLVRIAAIDETSQPAPGDVGATLVVDDANAAHVLVSWSPTATAAAYAVFRADVPAGPFSEIDRVGGTSYEDRDEMLGGPDRYYRVRAADACGNLGP